MDAPFQPFDGDDREQDADNTESTGATRLRDIPLRTIFPNLLTVLAICSGLTAIRFAIEGRMELAVGAIILAAILDGVDGRVARFLKSESRFGEQMDSLADFVNFGVAPAMILYFSMLNEIRSLGWIVSLIYAVCACLRLARFNAMLDAGDAPEWQKNFFTGVPAPAGAMIVLIPVYLALLGVSQTGALLVFADAFTLVVGLLMVSSLPTFSGKDLSKSVRRDLVMPLIILAVAMLGLLFAYPWVTLLLISIGYLISLPFSAIAWKKKTAEEQSAATSTAKK